MKKILVIGDVIRDDYIESSATRMCQEAPNLPIIDAIGYPEHRLGGAANVAENIKSLTSNEQKIDVYLSGIFDEETLNLAEYKSIKIYNELSIYGDGLIKTRYYSRDNEKYNILARIDNEFKYEDNDCGIFQENFIEKTKKDNFDIVLISDYDKGTINEELSKFLIKNFPFVVVDSKRKDLSIFKGAQILKVNMQEYSDQISPNKNYILEELFDSVIVTNGKNGSLLKKFNRINDTKYNVTEEFFPTKKSNQIDVTGCGDVHVAAFCVYLLNNFDKRRAINFANLCASLAVEKFGTTKITWKDLKENGYEIG